MAGPDPSDPASSAGLVQVTEQVYAAIGMKKTAPAAHTPNYPEIIVEIIADLRAGDEYADPDRGNCGLA